MVNYAIVIERCSNFEGMWDCLQSIDQEMTKRLSAPRVQGPKLSRINGIGDGPSLSVSIRVEITVLELGTVSMQQ